MAKHKDMMILPVKERRAYFKQAYALELGKLHTKGICRWPIEDLPKMVEAVMDNFGKRRAPSGPAFDAVKKFFGLRSNKATFEFLGY